MALIVSNTLLPWINIPVSFNNMIVYLLISVQYIIYGLLILSVMNHWSKGYYEILPQIVCPRCDLHWKIIWPRLERYRSTCGSNLNSAPKNLSLCRPDAAAKHCIRWDSNVFPHADTIATFQFQLNLKPPISIAEALIEIWNPAYIQAITENTRLQLLSVCSGKWEEKKQQGSATARTHFSLFIIQ